VAFYIIHVVGHSLFSSTWLSKFFKLQQKSIGVLSIVSVYNNRMALHRLG